MNIEMFVPTGEVRVPKEGEWFKVREYGFSNSWCNMGACGVPYPIYTLIKIEYPKIEVEKKYRWERIVHGIRIITDKPCSREQMKPVFGDVGCYWSPIPGTEC